MTTSRTQLYQRKARWLRKIRKLQRDILRARRGLYASSLSTLPMDIVALGTRIKHLGDEGERIWQEYFDAGVTPYTIDALTDQLSCLERVSAELGDAAKRLPGATSAYIYYINTKAFSLAD